MSEDTHKRIHARVRGRVQGVGFRWFTQETAQELGLTGWVRNDPDGSVELEAQGPKDDLVTFRGRLREGPPMGRVEDLKVADRDPVEDESGFRISW